MGQAVSPPLESFLIKDMQTKPLNVGERYDRHRAIVAHTRKRSISFFWNRYRHLKSIIGW